MKQPRGGLIVFRSFVVVEPDPVVSMDLCGALTTEFPVCGVTVVDSLASVASFLSAQTSAICVIINSHVFPEHDHAPLQQVVEQAGHVIVIGSTVSASFPLQHVHIPFSTEMVLGAIMMAGIDETVRLPAAHA